MQQEQIISLECVKHIKIYKLKQLSLSNKDIAAALQTNVGHVFNVLKKYTDKPELVTKADAVTA